MNSWVVFGAMVKWKWRLFYNEICGECEIDDQCSICKSCLWSCFLPREPIYHSSKWHYRAQGTHTITLIMQGTRSNFFAAWCCCFVQNTLKRSTLHFKQGQFSEIFFLVGRPLKICRNFSFSPVLLKFIPCPLFCLFPEKGLCIDKVPVFYCLMKKI